MKLIHKMWEKYDQLKEPRRFFTFFIPAVFLVSLLTHPNIWISLTTGIFLLLLVSSRMYSFYVKRKEKENESSDEK
jgi:hypothetical protein